MGTLGTRIMIGAAIFSAVGCTPEDTFSLQFPRSALRQVSREARVFVFPTTACTAFDPRGAPVGDAATRTGRAPVASLVAPLQDEVGALPEVPSGVYTVVVEAWGPPCEDVGIDNADNATFCRQVSGGPSTVLRGYSCQTVELSSGQRQELVAFMTPLADMGAEFQLPESVDLDNPVARYDERAPQPVVEGTSARFPFRVQLIDELGNDDDDVAVHWAVETGRADFISSPTVVTGPDAVLGGGGVAAGTLRAARGAADDDGGRIVVYAYAPGYENAPFRFHARAVMGVRARLSQVALPASVDLNDVDATVSPTVFQDLNDDGRPDVLTVVGTSTHRLVALYDQGPMGFAARVSASMPRMARSIEVLRTGPGAPLIGVSVAQRISNRLISIPPDQERTYVIEDPAFELWDAFATIGEPDEARTPARVLTAFDGQPIRKAAISMDAGDIDGDGYDELVAARCSYLYRGELTLQNRFILCYGASVTDLGDSELAVLSAVTDPAGAVVDYRELAIIPYAGIPGGYRNVRLADLDGDTSLDVLANNVVQVLGRCGTRNRPSTGFDFAIDTNAFLADTGYSQNFGLAVGRFNDDAFLDIVSTGALRLNSPDAGFTVLPGGDCALPSRRPAVVSGPRTSAHLLDVESTDLNGDGWDDVVLLHRAARQLQLFFGAGVDDLAQGPVIDLPVGPTAEFDIARIQAPEGPVVRAAIPARIENSILFVDLRPDR